MNKKKNRIGITKETIGLITAILMLVYFFVSKVDWQNGNKNPPEEVKPDTAKDSWDTTTIDIPKLVNYAVDTVVLFIPSKLRVQEVTLDGESVNLLENNPTSLKLEIKHKSINQKLVLKSKKHLCVLNMNFSNLRRYSITLQENCQIIKNEI